MSNGEKGKSSFEESINVLKTFYEAVNKKSFNQGNNELSGKANNALTNWSVFVKSIEYLKEYIKPKIFDNDEENIKALEQKRADIDLNLNDSLKVLIDLYTDACKVDTNSFDSSKLEEVRKALEHQLNVVERMKNFALEMGAQSVCEKRPRIRATLPH